MKIGRFLALAAFLALVGAGCGDIEKILTERAPATGAPEESAGGPEDEVKDKPDAGAGKDGGDSTAPAGGGAGAGASKPEGDPEQVKKNLKRMNEILDQAISKNGDSEEDKKQRRELIAKLLILKRETVGLFPEVCGHSFLDMYQAFRKMDLLLDSAARQAGEFPKDPGKLIVLLGEVEEDKKNLEVWTLDAPEPCGTEIRKAIAELTKELDHLFGLLNEYFTSKFLNPKELQPTPEMVQELRKELSAGISRLIRLKRDTMSHFNTSWDAGKVDFREWYWLWEGFDQELERAFNFSGFFDPDLVQKWLFRARVEKAEMEKILGVSPRKAQGQLKFGFLEPSSGPSSGGTLVQAAGENIGGVAGVTVAGVPVPFWSFDKLLLFFTPPAEAEGVVDIEITMAGGALHTFPFTYQGEPSPESDESSRDTNNPGAIVIPAAVWSDDFNANKIDETRWRTETGGFGSAISQGEGRLEITHAANSLGSTFWSEAVSVCRVGGDFDVEVGYELLIWPPQNGVRVGLNLVAPDESEIAVERVSFAANEFTTQEEYLLDWGGFFNTVPAGDNFSGKLRITREDCRVIGYYLADGEWLLIDGRSVGTGDVSLKLASWSHQDKFSEKVVVGFDNFRLHQGELKCSG